MSHFDTEIIYSREDRDYSCYVIIDGQKEYIGSAPTYLDGEAKCRAYAYDHYADRDTPETAAQILLADPPPFDPRLIPSADWGAYATGDIDDCVCGNPAYMLIHGVHDYLDIALCGRCHTAYADPTPSEPSPGLEDNDDGRPSLPNIGGGRVNWNS